MKRLILVLVFSFILSSFSSFAAMPCDGYMSAGFGDPVSYPDCNIQCNGLSQVTCENENFPHRANCFREDRGGQSGQADGTGDVLHLCDWVDPGPSGPAECINRFFQGDPYVTYNGGNVASPFSYSYLESVCFDPSWIPDATCNFVAGSYIVKRSFCQDGSNGHPASPPYAQIKGLLETHPYQHCANEYDTIDTKKVYGPAEWGASQLPALEDMGSSWQWEGGFCLQYCAGPSGGDLTLGRSCDYGPGSDGDVVSGWDKNNCPSITQSAAGCSDATTAYTRVCDGASSQPFDLRNVNLGSAMGGTVRGLGSTMSTEDCLASFPPGAPECNEVCGDPGAAGNNICDGGEGGGICEWSSCRAGSGTRDLDDGEAYVTQFYSDCLPTDMTDDVVWAEGASIGIYGEYSNEVDLSSITFINGSMDGTTWPYPDDRASFETEACGDDGGESTVTDITGALCCDEFDDEIIRNIVDNVPGDGMDMAGDYCVPAGVTDVSGCGNFVRDGVEDCDGLYTTNTTTVYTWNGTAYNISSTVVNTILVLGDGCSGSDVCQPDCTCASGGPVVCGDGVTEGTEECDEGPGGNIDGDGGCDSNCDWECGDGSIDNDDSDGYDEVCDPPGSESGTCSGTFRCESDCQSCFDTGGPGTPPGSSDVAQTIFGDCACPAASPNDCSDGVGEMQVIYLSPGGATYEEFQECFLASENVPFMSSLSIVIVALLLAGFYFFDKKRKK
jgi:hypothetical protein